MTIEPGSITAALQESWVDVDLEDTRPLTGGEWATLAHLRLTGTPTGVPDDVVLRVVPDAEMGAKELAVQTAMAESGIPTPRVHLTGPVGGPLTNAWAVMDLAPGQTLVAGLDGAAAIRRLPQILARLPRQLADTMTAIHGVDPGPVAERVRNAAPTAAFTIDELWAHLHAGALATGRRDLTDALSRLAQTQPGQGGAVVCHGDLHPFNLLNDGDHLTVLDWTAAILAPPAYDASFTWLLLRHPPLATPAALRPVIRAGATALARRFLHRYRDANPSADLSDIDWYAGLHATRILIDLAIWQRNQDPRAHTHPWQLVAPGARQALRHALAGSR